MTPAIGGGGRESCSIRIHAAKLLSLYNEVHTARADRPKSATAWASKYPLQPVACPSHSRGPRTALSSLKGRGFVNGVVDQWFCWLSASG